MSNGRMTLLRMLATTAAVPPLRNRKSVEVRSRMACLQVRRLTVSHSSDVHFAYVNDDDDVCYQSDAEKRRHKQSVRLVNCSPSQVLPDIRRQHGRFRAESYDHDICYISRKRKVADVWMQQAS